MEPNTEHMGPVLRSTRPEPDQWRVASGELVRKRQSDNGNGEAAATGVKKAEGKANRPVNPAPRRRPFGRQQPHTLERTCCQQEWAAGWATA